MAYAQGKYEVDPRLRDPDAVEPPPRSAPRRIENVRRAVRVLERGSERVGGGRGLSTLSARVASLSRQIKAKR